MLQGSQEKGATTKEKEWEATYKNHVFEMLDKMRSDDFLCDVTLLVCTVSNSSKTYEGLFTHDTTKSSPSSIFSPLSIDIQPIV